MQKFGSTVSFVFIICAKFVIWKNPLFFIRNFNVKTRFPYHYFFSEKNITFLKFIFLYPFQVSLVGRKYNRIIVNHFKSLRNIERNITHSPWLPIMFLTFKSHTGKFICVIISGLAILENPLKQISSNFISEIQNS